MPGANDVMLTRLTSELEDRRAFQDQLVEGAQNANPPRDLNAQELELYQRASTRMSEIEAQLAPMRESARISADSARRTAELATLFSPPGRGGGNGQAQIEYRSAGAYISDVVRAQLGNDEAAQRLEHYNRAAAHQTTADNPGLLPERLLGTILGTLDTARPLVSAIGPQQLPTGSWSRPRVTQHTQVGKQAGEKTELVSRKMLIDKIPIDAETFGGYVNVSRQNVDWSQPTAIDVVIRDLTNEYGFETEEEAGLVFATAATAGPTLPTGAATAQQWSDALWAAAGTVFANMWAQRMPVGRMVVAVAPNMLGLIGPLFPPVNPTNSQSVGFSAAAFGEGTQGSVAGISHVVSGSLAAGTALVISSNAAEVYEDRLGALQVVEPSVLGTQVAYAGYFKALPLIPTGIVKITKTP
jgi:HK97 family phage major capsid protein